MLGGGAIADGSRAGLGRHHRHDELAAVDLAGADAAARHVVERDLATFRRNGVDRDPATRERIAALRARLTELGTRFERNIFTDVRTIRLHPEALAGVPDDWVAAHSPDEDGLLAIELTPANIGPLVTFAERDSVRAKAFQAMSSVGHPQNVAVVDSLRALRHELAALLGFPSWAAYAMEPMMAGSPDRVRDFLAEVDGASAEATRRELAALLEVQRSEEPMAETVDLWSYLYWQHRLQQQAYGYDEQAMREYLPYARVRDGILATFEQVFGLEFRPAPDAPAWSPDVEPYEVWEDGALVGRFYLDMQPREGKFRHFAAFPLRRWGGTLPEIALVCNFPGGGEGDPGLLSPDQMSTFFHEFGHLVHYLMAGRAPLATDFEMDFLEAPSQLLEVWAGDPAVLARFARHYRTDEPIPAELVASYRRAGTFGRALNARTSLWLAALTLDLHTAPPAADPTAAVEERVTAAYLPFERPDWLHPSSSVPHISLYSSNYYTYLWSDVIARDLLTGFNRDDLLDPEAGRRYRDLVLAPTGTAPSAVLVERFLGRPFNAAAWRRWLEGEEAGATPSAVHVAPPTGEREADRAAIIAALEQVRPGGTVQFAAGTYRIGEIIRVDVPRVTLLGHPQGTTLRGCVPDAFSEFPAAFFACNGLELTGGHQTVRNLTFEYAWHGLHVGCCNVADMEELQALQGGKRREPSLTGMMQDNVIDGNRLLGAEGVGIELLHASGNRIVNNTISGIAPRDPFPGSTLGQPPAWREANGAGIWISPGSDENEIVGNFFEDVANAAVVIEGARNRVEKRGAGDTVRDLGSGNRVDGSGDANPAATSGSPPVHPAPGESVALRRGPVIDIHHHTAPIRSAAHADSLLAWMDSHGIEHAVLFVHDTAGLQWRDRAPERFTVATSFPCHEGRFPLMEPCFPEWNGWPDLDWIREQHAAGRIGALGEVLNVYYGIPPSDERLAPYFALTEELGIPVGVHTGRGPPPQRRPQGCCPNFDDDHGNPALLEPVLRRHPGLRVWLMHAGGPYLDEAIALMRAFPNVYADMSILNSVAPIEYEAQSLRAFFDAGLGDRSMLGTDNVSLERILERLGSFDFLDEAQRRAILYDNAARFLRTGDGLGGAR